MAMGVAADVDAMPMRVMLPLQRMRLALRLMWRLVLTAAALGADLGG